MDTVLQAGSVQVRVRRDADEQLVLAHVFNRLSNLVRVLTIQIFKDDWTRGSAFAVLGSSPFGPLAGGPGGQAGGRAQSPTQDYAASYLPVSSFRPLPAVSGASSGGGSAALGGVASPPRPVLDSVAGLGRVGGGGAGGGSTTARLSASATSQFSPVDLA